MTAAPQRTPRVEIAPRVEIPVKHTKRFAFHNRTSSSEVVKVRCRFIHHDALWDGCSCWSESRFSCGTPPFLLGLCFYHSPSSCAEFVYAIMDSDTSPKRHSSQTAKRNEIRTSVDKPDIAHIAEPHQAAFFADFETKDEEWVAYQSKKLLRKVDLHLLPLLIVLYMLNFLDRSNLAQAREGTLEKDLGMSGTDFNLATSIFFVRNTQG